MDFALIFLTNWNLLKTCEGIRVFQFWLAHCRALRKFSGHNTARALVLYAFHWFYCCIKLPDISCLTTAVSTNKQFCVQIQLNAFTRALVYCANICNQGGSRNALGTFVPIELTTANPSFRTMNDSWYLMVVQCARRLQCCGEMGCDFVVLISGSLV